MPALHVELDAPLPTELSVGAGTVVFVCGWCFCPEARIAELHFDLDGQLQPVAAHGMPRLDPFRDLHPGVDPFALAAAGHDLQSELDPDLHSYASGFWGIARIDPPRPEATEITINLRARLRAGTTVTAELSRINLTHPEPPPPAPRAPVAICMATYNPPADLLRRQIESIKAQTYDQFVCLISDDHSSPTATATIETAIAGDERFVLSCAPRRLGFYRNFERALTMVPPHAQFVLLSDQDDHWHPDKLETLVNSLGTAQLVYSDARVIGRDGGLMSETYWSRRANNHTDLLSLLVANSVTGAASLFRKELLDYALPFPPAQFAHYHDHWLALTALALGDIEYVPRALYDYVQHGGASLGHATANQMPALSERLRSLRTRSVRDRMRKWRMHYFVDIARLTTIGTVLELRCKDRMAAGKLRTLRAFTRGERSPRLLARLAARGARELTGRPETLGAEWMLFGALLWRQLLEWSASELPRTRLRLDALPPPDLAPGPARAGTPATAATRAIAEKTKPLDFELHSTAPRRINVLIPSVDLQHLFGGYIAKFNLARRLAERGHRVRVLTVDANGPLPRSWARTLESCAGLSGLTDVVEFEFGRESRSIQVNPDDGFVATTWWTAHIAHSALQILGAERFLYLIQEYEPFTFPMGTYAALAQESYAFPHSALFSTELLRGYFRAHGIGVYAPNRSGDEGSRAFNNAITEIAPPTVAELQGRTTPKLLFYARPEPHAARNLFELGALALAAAAQDGRFAGWELHGIGAQGTDRQLRLGNDATLTLLPRTEQQEYGRMLRDHDLGLALMYTPHPSLVPIEMASAGMLTVTNSFENKTADALTAISPNLITAEPTVDSVANALARAAAATTDYERRVQGAAAVTWPRDWDEALNDGLLSWVESALGVAVG